MDWQTTRNQFMRTTGGDPPGAQLEDELITAYTNHPDAVERSIEKITLAYQAGKIRSPWGALKTEVAKAVDTARNPTHDRGASREKHIQRAEQRIRNELVHYDLASEVRDELFGDRGTLRNHHTTDLEQRMLALWAELRPLGELAEHDQAERLERIRQQKLALASKTLAEKLAAPEPGNLEPVLQTP